MDNHESRLHEHLDCIMREDRRLLERLGDDQPMPIREVRSDELSMLQEIEVAAGRCFVDVGMPEVARDEPLAIDELERYRRAGLAWVAVNEADRPIAYLIAEPVDGCLHIEQVSVHPRYARRGIGRALLAYAGSAARNVGAPALTLTTFAHVPWNAPYYRRCGFRVMDESEWTTGLRSIREREAAQGLDRWPRVCMHRELHSATS